MAQQNNDGQKSIYEMSDFEFMAYADYLSSPYYRSYMEARNRPPVITAQRPVQENAPRRRQQVVLGDYRRRKGFLILMMLCTLLIIAVAAIGFVGIDAIDDYVAGYATASEENIGLLDPVFGLLQSFDITIGDKTSVFYEDCLKNIDTETEMLSKVVAYAMPILTALILIFSLAIFIAAIAGLAKKWVGDKKYVNKKVKLVVLSLLVFIFSLLLVVCGTIWDGAGFAGILDFVLGNTTSIVAGYGLYAVVGLSLLNFIFNLFAYKKNKNKLGKA